MTWLRPSTSSSRCGALPSKPICTDVEVRPHPPSASSFTQSSPSAVYGLRRRRSRHARARRRTSSIAGLEPTLSSSGATVTCASSTSYIQSLLAVGDDHELRRLGVRPAKAIRARERQRTRLRLEQPLIGAVELLLEVGASGLFTPSRNASSVARPRAASIACGRCVQRAGGCAACRATMREESVPNRDPEAAAPALRGIHSSASFQRCQPPPSSRPFAPLGCSRSSNAAECRRWRLCAFRSRSCTA